MNNKHSVIKTLEQCNNCATVSTSRRRVTSISVPKAIKACMFMQISFLPMKALIVLI